MKVPMEMRRLFLLLFLLTPAVLVKAQFGYYSNSNVLQALPSYQQAAAEYEHLCQRCEKEIEHNERELTRQYVAFLDGYRDFPEPILRKRQNELQHLVDNSVKFRKELKAWLAEAKDSLFAPSREAVYAALEKVCIACDIDYVIDTDEAAYSYINPNKAIDITTMLLDAALYPDKPVTELDGYGDCARLLGIQLVDDVSLIDAETTSGTVVDEGVADSGIVVTEEFATDDEAIVTELTADDAVAATDSDTAADETESQE